MFSRFKERKIQYNRKSLIKFGLLEAIQAGITGLSLWKIRGFMDQFFGGAGLRRGRRHPTELNAGDALDFWRVIYADKNNQKLLLYAEMVLTW